MKRSRTTFEDSLTYFKTVLGEQDYRKTILDLHSTPLTYHYSFNVNSFLLDNSCITKKTMICNALTELFDFCQKTNYEKVSATLMEPEYIGLPSHYVSVIVFPKIKKVLYFDSAKSLNHIAVYCAEMVESLLKITCKKLKYSLEFASPANPIQYDEDDTYCQTWSLIFLLISTNKTYEEIKVLVQNEFDFATRNDKIDYLVSKIKDILSNCENTKLDKCIEYQSHKKRKYVSIKSDLGCNQYY